MPPDSQVVVRGGVLSTDTIEASVQTEFEDSEIYGLSVFTFADMTADEIFEAAELPHNKLMETTVGHLRASGFVVDHCDGLGHCLVVFDGMPDGATRARLVDTFDSPRPSPRAKKK